MLEEEVNELADCYLQFHSSYFWTLWKNGPGKLVEAMDLHNDSTSIPESEFKILSEASNIWLNIHLDCLYRSILVKTILILRQYYYEFRSDRLTEQAAVFNFLPVIAFSKNQNGIECRVTQSLSLFEEFAKLITKENDFLSAETLNSSSFINSLLALTGLKESEFCNKYASD